MQDEIYVLADGKLLENFLNYRVESNLFVADDAFSLGLADPDTKVEEGSLCELYVNGVQELTGIIESIDENCDKSGKTLTVEGRDLLGMLTDSYAEEFLSLEKIGLKALANRLLRPFKFINRKDIVFDKGNKLRAVPLTKTPEDFEFAQVEPGQSVFEALNGYAVSQGMLLFSKANGTLVFGEPKTSGAAEFDIVFRRDGKGNNAFRGGRNRNISKRYSKVIVTGQKQGTATGAAADVNAKGEVVDDTFPKGLYKPFVATVQYDGQDPKKYARVLMDKQRFDGNKVTYSVKGHSQNKKNWQVNSICSVEDTWNNVHGEFLIYGRTFELDREQGPITTLQLSTKGVLPA